MKEKVREEETFISQFSGEEDEEPCYEDQTSDFLLSPEKCPMLERWWEKESGVPCLRFLPSSAEGPHSGKVGHACGL